MHANTDSDMPTSKQATIPTIRAYYLMLRRKLAMPLETCPVYPHLLGSPHSMKHTSYNIAQAPSITKNMRLASEGLLTHCALSQAVINQAAHSTCFQAAKIRSPPG
eukprot:1159873-Pelagomonas_calceolata.AAC.9